MSADEIFNDRKNKFLRIGRNKGFIDNLDDLSSLKPIIIILIKLLNLKKFFNSLYLLFALISLLFFYKAPQHLYIFFLIHKNKVHFYSFFFQYILDLF